MDKQRKQLLMRRLGKMLTIRAATLRLTTGELVESHHRYPRIDDTPHAMQSWLLCRLVLHDYGAGIAFRLAIYLAIALLLMVMQGAQILVLLLASAFGLGGVAYSWSGAWANAACLAAC